MTGYVDHEITFGITLDAEEAVDLAITRAAAHRKRIAVITPGAGYRRTPRLHHRIGRAKAAHAPRVGIRKHRREKQVRYRHRGLARRAARDQHGVVVRQKHGAVTRTSLAHLRGNGEKLAFKRRVDLSGLQMSGARQGA